MVRRGNTGNFCRLRPLRRFPWPGTEQGCGGWKYFVYPVQCALPELSKASFPSIKVLSPTLLPIFVVNTMETEHAAAHVAGVSSHWNQWRHYVCLLLKSFISIIFISVFIGSAVCAYRLLMLGYWLKVCYKLKLWSRVKIKLLKLIIWKRICIMAVSYTHLDVYKRQELHTAGNL